MRIIKVGLIDVDGHNFPNLPLMKLSAWHKQNGDIVEWYQPLFTGYCDRVYMSKVFSFTADYSYAVNAGEVFRGGSGYCIELEYGNEVYHTERDIQFPDSIENVYPDYSLYPKQTKDIAYGFLTRGCPRGCSFCHVAAKEGRCSRKVANLRDFWDGQEYIRLCDPNTFACRDWEDLLGQLVESRAIVDFTQGIDVRLATPERIQMLNKMRINMVHLAWDQPHQDLTEDFRRFSECYIRKSASGKIVYVLTNFDSTLDQDLHRIYTLRGLGFNPYIMVYDKEHADPVYKDLQRWVNNRRIWWQCKRFEDYVA